MTVCRLARWLSLALLVLTAVLLTACALGPEPEPPTLTAEERNAQILAIAERFAATGDVEGARIALQELGLPNVEQVVLAMVESHIAQGQDPEATDRLLGLAQALGPLSRMASEYLARQGGAAVAEVQANPTDTLLPPTDTPVPTDTPEPTATATPTPEPTATPTATPLPEPQVLADSQGLNVRGGPGTLYPVVGQMRQGDTADILARSADGSWWQVVLADGSEGWVFANLVTVVGPLDQVAVAQDIAPPPVQPTPTPAEPPTPTPAPQPAVDFVIVKQRMLHKDENAGCMGNHHIFAKVVDVNGAPLDGVTIRRVWSGDEGVSGAKGSDYLGRPDGGWLEFALFKNGDQVTVVRDVDGRSVTSDVSMSAEQRDEVIGAAELMDKGYCGSIEECQQKIDQNALCRFHYSYEIVFQRQY